MSAPSLVVGLGNPGPEHTGTRHNAGFWFVDALVREYGGAFAADKRFHGDVATTTVAGNTVRVLKPGTYMNRSGQAVRALAQFYKVPVDGIVVAHDDLDLAPGTVRLKRGGGHGGHNGLRDLVAHLGADFYRLRFGIGHPRDAQSRDEPVDWVLKKPSKQDFESIAQAIDAAVAEFPNLFAERGDERVMERLNRRSPE